MCNTKKCCHIIIKCFLSEDRLVTCFITAFPWNSAFAFILLELKGVVLFGVYFFSFVFLSGPIFTSTRTDWRNGTLPKHSQLKCTLIDHLICSDVPHTF